MRLRETSRLPARWIDEYVAQLDAVLESVDEGLLICNPVGRVLWMNRRALEIHGYASVADAWRTLSEYAGAFQLYDLEGHPIPVDEGPLRQVVGGETFREWKVRLHSKQTGREWIGCCGGAPVRDAQGRAVLGVLSLREIKEPADEVIEGLARLARLPQESPDPILRVSAEHVLVYSNPAGERLGRAWGCRIGQKVTPLLRTIVSAALADGAVARRKAAFDSRVYALTVAPSVADGYVNVYARDVTDFIRAKESLRQAEQKFRTIFDNTSDGIFLLDLETRRFAMCNRSCLDMFGYTEDEFMRLHIPDLHLEEDLPFIDAQIKKFVKGREGARHDLRFRRKDGSIVFVDLSPSLIVLDGRRYILVALKDMTERKRAEDALAASERKYRSLVENIPDVTWTTDRQGRTLFISPNVRDVYGYSAEEVCASGDTWLGNVHPDDRSRIEGAFRQLFTEKKPYDVEYRIRREDGTWIWLHDRSVSSYEKDGQWYADGIFSDITERKRMEEELRRHTEHLEELVAARTRELQESEAGLAAAQRLAHVGSWQWDIATDTARWSEETFRVFGIAPGPLQQHREDFLSRIVPEDRPRVDQALADAVSGAKDYDLDYRITLPDGRERVIHAQAQVLRSHDGQPVTMHGTVQDITERKRAEEALAESRRRYRGLVERINDWVWEIDANGVYTYSSPRVLDLLGYAPEDVVGKMPFDFMPPAEAQRVWNAFEPIWLERKPLELFENTLVRKDSSLVIVETSGMPVFAEDGSFLGYTGIDRDVTSRIQAQEALRESEQRYRRLVENLKGSHFIYRHDTTGMLTYVSESVTEVVGYTLDEGMPHYGKYFTDHPANQAAHRHTELTLQGIRQPPYEVNVWHKDGSTRWLEVQEVPVYDADGKVVAVEGVAQDITGRKRAEEALRSLNEQLEQQVARRTETLRHTLDRLRQLTLELSQAEDRERKRIADILHEDVQQTLAAARFHVSLLSGVPGISEQSREVIEQVRHMIRDAIERCRSLSHELSPAMFQVELVEILNWLARHMQRTHGLTVHVEADGQVDSPSEPLKAFLYRVTQELLFNVVKHAGVREASVRVRRRGQNICLLVADRGRGFETRELEGVDRFGLLGIRERVQLLGGRMKIRSTPGLGSQLVITVPDRGGLTDVVP